MTEFESYVPYGDIQRSDPQRASGERRQIWLLGLYAGSAILLYILLQNLLISPLMLFGVYAQYQNDPLLQDGIDILIVLISLLLPFALFSMPMRRISGLQSSLPLDAPQRKDTFLLAIPAGLAFCIIANNITSVLISWLTMLGVELSSPDVGLPAGVFGVTVAIFRVVLLPAITEEVCFRGFVMQNLRKFGDWFAILMSALVFGLMHGNLIQAPFAAIVGIALGYFVIKTGSLWTGILIHACNNFLSVLFSYLGETLPEAQLSALYLAIENILLVIGLACFLIFLYRYRGQRLPQTQTQTRLPGKCGAYLAAPTMLIAIAAMLYFTSKYVGLGG